MVWLPTASVEMVNVAWPVASTGTVAASVTAPSVNVTVPVGVPVPPVTVAVNVTVCPKLDGFGEELTAVTVPFETTCGLAESLPLLESQPVAPLNVAVMVCLPTASVLVLNKAIPDASTGTFAASVTAPSVNVTVPAGTPAPASTAVTVAVKVTNCPNVDGFGVEVS